MVPLEIINCATIIVKHYFIEEIFQVVFYRILEKLVASNKPLSKRDLQTL